VLLFTGFGFTLDWFFRFYIIPVNMLAEAIQLKTRVNPGLDIEVSGSHDVMRLAEMVEQIIMSADAELDDDGPLRRVGKVPPESEKDVLAALLEGLPLGIVVCNLDAVIVFFNRKAKEILDGRGARGKTWVGLGRSLYSVIDASLVERALERIAQKIDENQFSVSERFLVGGASLTPMPAEIVPVLDSQHHLSGFIIHIEDTVEKFRREQETLDQFQTWQQQLTQSISVIKATAEILGEADTIQAESDRMKLINLLVRESGLAANILTSEEITRKWRPKQPWPLTEVDAGQWYLFLRHRAAETIAIDLQLDVEGLNAQISIDMHHLSNALLFVLDQVGKATESKIVSGHFYRRDAWLYLDLAWHGKKVEKGTLERWKSMLPVIGDTALTISLGDILSHHGVKLWPLGPVSGDVRNGVRLLLPVWDHSELVSANGHVTILPDSRPEFYDFDLFQQAGQNAALDDTPLSELSYTVFDTETTGLDPQGGDEIISIGAMRIVNGRLLKTDRFDQLIDPRRNLPWASVKYHGIRPEMLEGKPAIEQVLPTFFEYCRDTVMLGHNVAFDMRMLQLKEDLTGVRFINPVLDTMLLSAVVQPTHHDHGLNAIAQRMGITIVGRHTAIGDAAATGEIFIKLISLLRENGIRTLIEARRACEKTYYARLKY
jgi:DNA polymerase-3 subunit epsilon